MKTALYRRDELRAFETRAGRGLPGGTLMARAGASVARMAMTIGSDHPGKVLVAVGRGNNGGDGLIAARELLDSGVPVEVALLKGATPLGGEAATAAAQFQAAGGKLMSGLEGLGSAALVIDALFGIGLSRAVDALPREWILAINRWREDTGRPVLAVDVPSGLDADSGKVLGIAVRASHTLTFLGHKCGLFTGAGPDHTGLITLETLATIDSEEPAGLLNGVELFGHYARARPHDAHKGMFGSIGVLAGSRGMVGAGLLCARAALFSGAGRVYLRSPESDLQVDSMHPEIMVRESLGELRLDALAAGPGLGTRSAALAALRDAITRAVPLVLDADALNVLAQDTSLAATVRARGSATVMTPHPLEAARLLQCDIAAIQSNRIDTALRLASQFNSVVVLKGAGSVIARPDGCFVVNPTGNAGLSSGGTGDVLTGVLGALIAQGWPAFEGTLAATWLHGRAAELLVASGTGPVGLSASELFVPLRRALNDLCPR